MTTLIEGILGKGPDAVTDPLFTLPRPSLLRDPDEPKWSVPHTGDSFGKAAFRGVASAILTVAIVAGVHTGVDAVMKRISANNDPSARISVRPSAPSRLMLD